MIQGFQHNFLTTEPDPNILSSSFKLQTNWHVITGATCSGKTTLINQLADKGFQIVPEVARQYYESESKKRTIGQDREKLVALSRDLTDILLITESGLRASDVLFLDRAFPDQLTYYRIHGLNPNKILADCFHHRYASVFILDRFSFNPDGVRYEDEKTAEFLDEWHARDYSALGYDVVRVPVIPPAERVAFVLEKLSNLLLI